MNTDSDSVSKLTVSVDEAAEMLGVSPGLVYVMVRKKQLRAIRLGRRILIPRRAVEALVQADGTG
ncbi:MAG: helix-turn-helix domain-containing protein [Acidimicrobiales bacterium]